MKMKATKKIFALLGAAMLILGAQAVPSISIKSVRQRYPWNNIVDVVYTVSGYALADADRYVVTFDATVGETTYECAGKGGMIPGNGDYTFEWDASAVGTETVAEDAKLTMKVWDLQDQVAATSSTADYEIWDLTDMATAPVYEKVPTFDGVSLQRLSNARYSDDKYKTTKLVLRRVRSGDTQYNLGANASPKVTVGSDYYIAIYQLTAAQYANIVAGNAALEKLINNNGGTSRETTYPTIAKAYVSWNAICGGLRTATKEPDGSTATSRANSDYTQEDTTAWRDNNDNTGDTCLLALMNSKKGSFSGKFALPTEAQWEVASRGNTGTGYYWFADGSTSHYNSNTEGQATLCNYAWCTYNNSNGAQNNNQGTAFNGSPKLVGLLTPNPWGIYDMYGNVWEWCRDTYDGSGFSSCTAAEYCYAGAGRRVLRGGACNGDANGCSSAYRGASVPGYVYAGYGIRLVRVSE